MINIILGLHIMIYNGDYQNINVISKDLIINKCIIYIVIILFNMVMHKLN